MASRRRSDRKEPALGPRQEQKRRETNEERIKRVSGEFDDTKRKQALRWFRIEEPHESVFALDRRIGRFTSARMSLDVYHAFLYDDAELAALFSGIQAQGEFTPQTMVSNIVKRQIQTYVARQDKNRPSPMALPNDGTYAQGKRAEELTKLFKGILSEIEYYPKLSLRRRDRAIFGDGFCHNYRVGRKLFHERAFPFEFRQDPREAMYGSPRTLIRRRWIDRLVLCDRFPEHEEAIMTDEYSPADELYDFARDQTNDMVFMLDIWHLPSGEIGQDEENPDDAKDGAHAMCIQSQTLSHKKYIRPYFPVSHTHFDAGLVGWRGEGMAAALRGLQYEVNSIGLRMQEQAWMTGTYVWTKPDDGLEVDHLDNGTLTHIQSEEKPEFFAPQPWHPQIFEYYQFLRGRAPAEESRLSEQATRGEMPPGLESGKAIRAWNQLDDQAFLSHGQEDERDCIDTCWQFFDLCEEIHEEEKANPKSEPFIINSKGSEYGRSVREKLEYAKIRMDRKDFDLDVWPTGLLSGSPSEQMEDANDLAAKGLISRDAIMDLLDLPDVQRVMRLETAPRRVVLKILEKILSAKDPQEAYVYPESAMNLELCKALGLQVYLDGFEREAPEENLRMVLQFALDAEQQLEGAQPPAPAPAFAPPPQPILPQNAAPPAAVPMTPQMGGG